VVLSGHEHNYERFAPQDANGRLDRKRGIRQFVVGTGGSSHDGFGRILKTSEVRNAETFGVLVLTLRRASYAWVFVPVGSRLDRNSERIFLDSGSAHCH
jgi:acid phosphatase type 7